MQTKTDGLIIRELNVGENDRIVTILTRGKGVIRASARGARRIKSRIASATQLLCYAGFTLFRGREKYIIDEADPLEFFMGIRQNLEKLALGQYFAQLSGFLTPEEEPAEQYLRLALNALHLIENDKRPLPLVKGCFEMRLLAMSGYMPDLVACRECGTFESETMYLDPGSGGILCGNCADEAGGGYPLSPGALAALRYAVYADFERLFSFSLSGRALNEFAAACEGYLLYRLERSFPTLDFYRGLAGG